MGPQAKKQLTRRETQAALAEADAWLEMSGAKSYEPFLHVERAELARLVGDDTARRRELREAYRLFTQIGAPIRAEEVAKELARMRCPSCGHDNREPGQIHPEKPQSRANRGVAVEVIWLVDLGTRRRLLPGLIRF